MNMFFCPIALTPLSLIPVQAYAQWLLWVHMRAYGLIGWFPNFWAASLGRFIDLDIRGGSQLPGTRASLRKQAYYVNQLITAQNEFVNSVLPCLQTSSEQLLHKQKHVLQFSSM
jgi:hypothetical protein